MTSAVFDSSALLALMLKERGSEIVAKHMDGAVISAVNLAEVGSKMSDRGSSMETVADELRAAQIVVVPFDEALAGESARLRAATREWGLSLGDRACLALGLYRKALVVTSDQDWVRVGLPVEILLFR